VIDPAGRVRLRLPVFQPASAVVDVARLDVASPYTRFGDWFGWLVTAAALWALWSSGGLRGRSARPSLLELRA
jgi:apolipoprotein N-acyltransferase